MSRFFSHLTSAKNQGFVLNVSLSQDRSTPLGLENQIVTDVVYIFLAPELQTINKVEFYLDALPPSTPFQIENNPPYDFAGGSVKVASPFDTSSIADGIHQITANVHFSNNNLPAIITTTFTIRNQQPSILVDKAQLQFSAVLNSATAQTELITVTVSDALPAQVLVQIPNAPAWIHAQQGTVLYVPQNGSAVVTVSVDSTGLSVGTYMVTLLFIDPNNVRLTAQTNVQLVVTAPSVNQFSLQVSQFSDRSSPKTLQGNVVQGNVFIFLLPELFQIQQVTFFLDAITAPFQTENNAPYDFAGGSRTSANSFNTTSLFDGAHVITANVVFSNGSTVVENFNFETANGVIPEQKVQQVHLSYTESSSTATSLSIVYQSLVPRVPPVLQYRLRGELLWTEARGIIRNSNVERGVLYQVFISPLVPSATYEYKILEKTDGSFTDIFETKARPHSNPFKFGFVADTGLIGRLDGLDAGTEKIRNEISKLPLDFLLLGGDYIYYNTDKRFGSLERSIDEFFLQWESVFSRIPILPQYGNHERVLEENVATWLRRFATPPGMNAERTQYSFDIGPDVHVSAVFVPLNQDFDPLSEAEFNWLRNDLVAAKALNKRIIVFMHVPCFGDGSNHPENLALRQQLGGFFSQLGVPILVLTAHDQAYERSFVLSGITRTGYTVVSDRKKRCMNADSNGVVWVKVSPGGKLSNINRDFSSFRSSSPPSWTAYRARATHMYSIIDVTDTEIVVSSYGVLGDSTNQNSILIDHFRWGSGITCNELVLNPLNADLDLRQGDTTTFTVTITSNPSSSLDGLSFTSIPNWIQVNPGTSPNTFRVTVTSGSLVLGQHYGEIIAAQSGFETERFILFVDVF